MAEAAGEQDHYISALSQSLLRIQVLKEELRESKAQAKLLQTNLSDRNAALGRQAIALIKSLRSQIEAKDKELLDSTTEIAHLKAQQTSLKSEIAGLSTKLKSLNTLKQQSLKATVSDTVANAPSTNRIKAATPSSSNTLISTPSTPTSVPSRKQQQTKQSTPPQNTPQKRTRSEVRTVIVLDGDTTESEDSDSNSDSEKTTFLECTVAGCHLEGKRQTKIHFSRHELEYHNPTVRVLFKEKHKYTELRRQPDKFIYCPCKSFAAASSSMIQKHAKQCLGIPKSTRTPTPTPPRPTSASPSTTAVPSKSWLDVIRERYPAMTCKQTTTFTALFHLSRIFRHLHNLPGRNGVPFKVPDTLKAEFLAYIEDALDAHIEADKKFELKLEMEDSLEKEKGMDVDREEEGEEEQEQEGGEKERKKETEKVAEAEADVNETQRQEKEVGGGAVEPQAKRVKTNSTTMEAVTNITDTTKSATKSNIIEKVETQAKSRPLSKIVQELMPTYPTLSAIEKSAIHKGSTDFLTDEGLTMSEIEQEKGEIFVPSTLEAEFKEWLGGQLRSCFAGVPINK
ncbi:hypothetical protein HDU79_009265 [Rhizoclosmatium sp. JEL0117]|nr:hypothetical protein HDU79_009265 [Rhizoclosmatium sp. JEL0117]